MFSSTKTNRFNASSFQIIKDAMLQADELPLAEFIDSDPWQAAFVRHDIDFGSDDDATYTPAVTLWGLISQVFFSRKRIEVAKLLCVASLRCGRCLAKSFASPTRERIAELD